MGRSVLEQSLRSAARQVLAHQSVARPASAMLRVLGAESLGQKIDKISRYVPGHVPVRIPPSIAPHAFFLIDSDHGRDQCASALWWKGWGGYESLVTTLFAACASRAKCVVDVGANTGLFSLIAAACSSTSHIHAFEPFPACQRMLEGNLRLNGYSARVTLHREALSDAPGTLNLYVPRQDHGLAETSCSLNADFREGHSEIIPVPVQTLDGRLAASGERVDLLKIDVETHEPQVLRGGAEVLDRDRPVVFLEVLVCADVGALNDLAARHAYTPICITDDALEISQTIAYRPGHINHLFWPTERLTQVAPLAARVHGAVRRV